MQKISILGKQMLEWLKEIIFIQQSMQKQNKV